MRGPQSTRSDAAWWRSARDPADGLSDRHDIHGSAERREVGREESHGGDVQQLPVTVSEQQRLQSSDLAGDEHGASRISVDDLVTFGGNADRRVPDPRPQIQRHGERDLRENPAVSGRHRPLRRSAETVCDRPRQHRRHRGRDGRQAYEGSGTGESHDADVCSHYNPGVGDCPAKSGTRYPDFRGVFACPEEVGGDKRELRGGKMLFTGVRVGGDRRGENLRGREKPGAVASAPVQPDDRGSGRIRGRSGDAGEGATEAGVHAGECRCIPATGRPGPAPGTYACAPGTYDGAHDFE